MHVHEDMRKVTSKTQVRSSSGSSNEIHSCRSSGTTSFGMLEPYGATVELVRERDGTATLADELRDALGPDRVRTGATELGLYRRDGSMLEGGASLVCFPTTTPEVQVCVAAAHRHGVPFVARGSGTGLAGGAVPLDGSVVIVTTKMNRVLSVD